MNLKKPDKSIAVRKNKIISFRIGDDESEKLNTIIKYIGVPRAVSEFGASACHSVHSSIYPRRNGVGNR